MAVLEADLEAASKMLGKPASELGVINARIKKACIAKGEQSHAQVILELMTPEEYLIVLQLGVEARLNSIGFSKVRKGDVDAAMQVAADNIEAFYKGTLRAPVGLATMKKKAPQAGDKEIAAEALKQAKEEVHQRIKDAGHKISHYSNKVRMQAAKDMLEDDEFGPPIWEKAERVVKERNKGRAETAAATKKKGDAKAVLEAMGIKVDPEAVKKAEARKGRGKKSTGIPAGLRKRGEQAHTQA